MCVCARSDAYTLACEECAIEHVCMCARANERASVRVRAREASALCQPKSGTASLTVPMSAFIAQGAVLMMPYTWRRVRTQVQTHPEANHVRM